MRSSLFSCRFEVTKLTDTRTISPSTPSVNDCARLVASFANLKAKHVGVFTDPTVAKLPVMKVVRSPFTSLGRERGRGNGSGND